MKKAFIPSIIIFLIAVLFSCTSIDRSSTQRDENSIPYALEEWKGVQGKVLAESTPYFVGPKKAPEGAPDVLVIMLDDARAIPMRDLTAGPSEPLPSIASATRESVIPICRLPPPASLPERPY
jgi:hypothetical protein